MTQEEQNSSPYLERAHLGIRKIAKFQGEILCEKSAGTPRFKIQFHFSQFSQLKRFS
jgi:hypothetical protein